MDKTKTKHRKTRYENWSKLLLGLLLIYLFVFGLAPMMQQLPIISDIHDHVQQNQIDATALYYTESEEFGDAEVSIRDSMNY